ncbi:hypothetical protein J7T55_010478 [Diaporthe amygdali]|uniref:uncharacterized protein n=1 Tax=Phomopsis amygdali TaxID=1214568 RepID=UPI0022FF28FA|nr:uncharacterized protein J7T55_010478 [Diaporthe amygdali]KAJ0115655.1 hypothetical protein J7T55_010478 [Diaporthe amygdali]
MAQSSDDKKRPPHVRHYPLDIHLPFENYEHRRLVARDILVNRIISKFLFPGSKELAEAYDAHRSKENGLHNFAPIKIHDRALARDLELLRKMLTTCSITDDHFEPLYAFKHIKVVSHGRVQGGLTRKTWQIPLALEEEGKVRVTVGEEIQDLVRRHYLETDDACLRLWLQAIQTPRPSSYDTLPKGPREEQSHIALAQKRKKRDAIHIGDDGKKWYPEDTQHLAALQAQLQATQLTPLHDGGASIPRLRQPLLSSRAARIKYLATSTDMNRDILSLHHEHFRDRIMDMVYPWPEGQAPRRVLHVPSWNWRFKKQWLLDMSSSIPVDFTSGMTGRGLDRDGIWSTSACRDGIVERGRQARRPHRRATSEPPHGMFTSAHLPRSFNHLRGFLTFPRMGPVTMYQRSRRRSLSRTRIAEMFDWNTRTRQDSEHEKHQNNARKDIQNSSEELSSAQEYSAHLYALSHRLEDNMLFYGMDIETVEWAELNKMLHKVFDESNRCEFGTHRCPNCAVQHLADCPKPCGFCGAPSPDSTYVVSELTLSRPKVFAKFIDEEHGQEAGEHGNFHTAPNCPVAKHNRCKCGPFPQYHVAAKCAVLCSRECGNTYPRGHFKHKNAMTCKARCCMCGMKGHSGSQCKLKRCRCGVAHLGQDCTWKVECHVKGCYRFLCGLHCVECGMSREKLEEGMRFEGRKCPACLESTGLADGVAAQSTEDSEGEIEENSSTRPVHNGSHRSRRRNYRKKRGTKPIVKEEEEAELPWYTPLQPRTRPIVVSKSGKRNVWKGPANVS